MSAYRYKLADPFFHKTGLRLEQRFENPWLQINRDGVIIVSRGYAWNGCSPAWPFLDLCWLGTPDGVVDYRTGRAKTYYASLVHDALCQFGAVPRRDADRLFFAMLKAADFKLAGLYYAGVRVGAFVLRKR